MAQIVLLVEDNEINAEGLQRLLQRRGFTVYIAPSGESAIEQYKHIRPSIVLMDLSLPIMDGFEATQAMRTYEMVNHLPQVPIIALTAHAMIADKARASEVGCTDFESKPIAITQLVEKIRKFLPEV